jgi:hypothetical protein
MNVVISSKSAGGKLTTGHGNSVEILPVVINRSYYAGILFTYESDDASLLAAGLVLKSELCGPVMGCRLDSESTSTHIRTSRLKNGKLRLNIHADEAMARASNFKRFFGGLLADSRLSLVAGEVAE